MAKAQEPEASQLAESQTTDQPHHKETPEETGANDDGQTETSPPAVVTATEDQLPPLAEPDADNDPQNQAPLQIDEQEESESDDADSAYGDSVASSSTSLAPP
ncbi:hypothetical protein VF21_07935 [Pseudogymnoascus sp. 05NY08]|nr:hypothetical protein VF21_07935 [Pseudogymnoascus sp. 05NY08]